MANATHIKALIRQAMEKQAASVDTARNDENTADVKDAVPASVDSQTAADAVGRMEKDPAVNIGTKAEASTDTDVNGMTKDKDDDQAFKSASSLQKLAAQLLKEITKAAETAITVDAAEGASTTPNTTDSEGTEEKLGDAKSDGAAAQTTTSAVQTEVPKAEEASRSVTPEADPAEKSAGVLASEIYKLANDLLAGASISALCKSANVLEDEIEGDVSEGDVDNLSDEEADELAAALQASAVDAADEGTNDADQVSDYLEAYQDAPDVMGGEGLEGAPAGVEGMPAQGGAEVDELAQMLEEAGISPEELAAAVSKSASAKKATDAGWAKLSKSAKRDVVLAAINQLGKE
jgi:hypothetical protein